jgi:predicted nucleic acid-binding protein
MVVVADISPINYFVLIDQIEILPWLYTRILIPPAVFTELKHPVAPCSSPDLFRVTSALHQLDLRTASR